MITYRWMFYWNSDDNQQYFKIKVQDTTYTSLYDSGAFFVFQKQKQLLHMHIKVL